MIESIAWRCVGLTSSALIAPVGAAEKSKQARASKANRARTNINDSSLKQDDGERPRSVGRVEILGLAVDFLRTGVGDAVLRQQMLGPAGLLHGVFFVVCGKSLLGQGQRRHTQLVVAPISSREQVPGVDFLVLGAQRIAEISNRPLVFGGIVVLN